MTNLPGFTELYRKADQLKPAKPISVMGAADPSVLEGISKAVERGWIHPYLCGVQAEIEQVAAQMGLNLLEYEIIDTDAPAQAAVELIHQGKTEMVMKGQIATPALMKAVLQKEGGLRTGELVCQMVLMESLRDKRSFLMTDTGINIKLMKAQQIELVHHAIRTCQKLGCEQPRIGLMTCTEKPNPAIEESVIASEIASQASELFGPEVIVNGPVSFDVAYSSQAAATKKLDGQQTGLTNAMVFPDLTSANLTVKAIMYTADCQYGGILCGTSHPVIFMSRADTPETRLNSMAYAIATLS